MPTSRPRPGRQRIRGIVRLIRVGDILVVLVAVFLAGLARFGEVTLFSLDVRPDAGFSYFWIELALVVGWPLLLGLAGAYNDRFLGAGPQEYTAVVKGTLWAFSAIAIGSYALNLRLARGYVLVLLPVGLALLLLARLLWRAWVARLRRRGEAMLEVLVVGEVGRANRLIHTFGQVRRAGFRVVGACTSGRGPVLGDVPVVGSEQDAASLAVDLGVDAVAFTSSSVTARRLAWALEGTGIDLMVVPGIHDVAAPRVETRPIDDVMLMYVQPPTFQGWKLVVKTAMDVVGAALLLVVLALPMLAIGLLVRRGDGGPALFAQERVGKGGRLFTMYKFRSMVVDAERLRADLVPRRDAADEPDRGPLFKLRNDPRVTPVGRLLRRTSLDELPQLFNILKGEMSLVGPRPPLPSEVAEYDQDTMRRLLVKPGLTGLWQVSGRSNLTWEESVRHDLYYVENWSVMGDILILLRTFRAVVTARGAY